MSNLGCNKDPVDSRDWKITRMKAVQAAKLPTSIDYTSKMSPVGDQGNEGTCVGFAVVDGMKEYQEDLEHPEKLNLSVRYVYEYARELDGEMTYEEGTYIRSAMQVITDKGVCPEDCWPYFPHIVGNPCPNADSLAEPYQEDGYWRISDIQAMKETLVANGPFVMSVEVYPSFFHHDHGIIPMPGPDEELEGGHAVCIVGYDDDKQLLKFKNSWGKIWGDWGYGYFTYDYVKQYMWDAWSAKDKLGDYDVPTPPSWWQKLINFLKWLFRINK
jgi:C1A family cysteine protease